MIEVDRMMPMDEALAVAAPRPYEDPLTFEARVADTIIEERQRAIAGNGHANTRELERLTIMVRSGASINNGSLASAEAKSIVHKVLLHAGEGPHLDEGWKKDATSAQATLEMHGALSDSQRQHIREGGTVVVDTEGRPYLVPKRNRKETVLYKKNGAVK